MAQLRHPPGGRDARIMLFAQFLDRTGSGVWSSAAVLYFTFVSHLSVRQVGLLLGVSAIVGVAGAPLAGHLASRFPARFLLVACHLLRLATMSLLLFCDSFATLLPVVAVTCLGDRAAKMLDMLFATLVAGERHSTYRGLSRSVTNAGYAVGAGVAALGLAVGTGGAYRALVLADAVSFLVAAVLVGRLRESADPRATASGHGTARPHGVAPTAQATTGAGRSPWRDRGYLLFVALDTPLNLDDSVLNVGMPLWLVSRTTAPHAIVPVFLTVNTVLVVVLQMRVSARAEGPRRAARAVGLYGALMLACCLVLAVSATGGTWQAVGVMLAAAVLVTLAELMRSVSSWELAVSLAPAARRPAYLGVAGVSSAVQKSAGPLLLTGAVMVAGPAGWIALGAAVAGVSLVQRRACGRRLDAMEAAAAALVDQPVRRARSTASRAEPVGPRLTPR
ncbi:MFS transporter [Streptantibioticus parmotrematis]|uniref:MFS transporter n=1 Tax=Streptantibioticus parmotrematis TaxID=2873249 RepID=UPI0034017ABA